MSKPRLTAKGLLSEAYGEHGCTVRLREEKEPGTNVILDYTTSRRRKESLGFPVRARERRRWAWDHRALERAREAAKDRSAELRLDRVRDAARPQTITVSEAFRLFNDPDRGALPPSPSLRRAHLRAEVVWAKALGADTPWNRIQRADVERLMRKYAERVSPVTGRGMIPTGLRYVEVLRACHRWLESLEGFEDLRDPTKGFAFARWRRKHTPRRPRYSDDEATALLKVRHDVDPRFALFLALEDDSGARGKAVRGLWRSMVDAPLDQAPDPEQAPHGWLVFPALKGQAVVLHFLTAFERRELEVAFAGYLRELEARWREDRVDYPLFPAVRRESLTGGRPVRVEQSRAYRPVTANAPKDWLLEAERAAKVEHVDGRAYHGFRRRAADYLHEATDLKALTVAGGWSSQRTPELIYLDKARHADRARARDAMDAKRRPAPESGPETVEDA